MKMTITEGRKKIQKRRASLTTYFLMQKQDSQTYS